MDIDFNNVEEESCASVDEEDLSEEDLVDAEPEAELRDLREDQAPTAGFQHQPIVHVGQAQDDAVDFIPDLFWLFNRIVRVNHMEPEGFPW